MTLELYAIFDSKLGGYLAPFSSANRSTAMRQFETAVMQEDHDFNIHAEDYSLWRLAQYDTEEGIILPTEKLCIAYAHEVLSRLNEAKI